MGEVPSHQVCMRVTGKRAFGQVHSCGSRAASLSGCGSLFDARYLMRYQSFLSMQWYCPRRLVGYACMACPFAGDV